MRAIALLLLLSLAAMPASGDEVTRSNAIAILAKPALPPDFPHFPYVDPAAPKGGDVTLASIGTYDSFNPFILRGTATGGMVSPWVVMPGGSGSGSSVGHVWESLLTSSADPIRQPAWGLAVLMGSVLCGGGGLLVSVLHLRRVPSDRLFALVCLTLNIAAPVVPLLWLFTR